MIEDSSAMALSCFFSCPFMPFPPLLCWSSSDLWLEVRTRDLLTFGQGSYVKLSNHVKPTSNQHQIAWTVREFVEQTSLVSCLQKGWARDHIGSPKMPFPGWSEMVRVRSEYVLKLSEPPNPWRGNPWKSSWAHQCPSKKLHRSLFDNSIDRSTTTGRTTTLEAASFWWENLALPSVWHKIDEDSSMFMQNTLNYWNTRNIQKHPETEWARYVSLMSLWTLMSLQSSIDRGGS